MLIRLSCYNKFLLLCYLFLYQSIKHFPLSRRAELSVCVCVCASVHMHMWCYWLHKNFILRYVDEKQASIHCIGLPQTK